MHSLAEQQNALLQTLFSETGKTRDQHAIKFIANYSANTPANGKNDLNLRGLQVYQANAQVAASRNLQAVYPVLEQLVGEDAFSMLARDLWHTAPPTRGDVAQWGEGLAALIQSIPELAEEAYLPDVARVEWALHQAATAANGLADFATLALLTQHDPAALTLQLAPGTVLINSTYPVASIVAAHLYDSPSFDVLGQKLRAAEPESALIWRRGLRPMTSLCTAAEATFLEQLLAGKSLLAALEASETLLSEHAVPFDFSAWLTHAAQSGLLLGARLL